MTTAMTPRSRPTRKAAKPVTFQEPLIERSASRAVRHRAVEPLPVADAEPARPTEHNGIPIIREEVRASPANPKAFFKVTKLYLSDESIAFGCLDCLFTGDTRVEAQHHRNAEHGAQFGKKTPKVTYPKDENLGDLVLLPRPDGIPAPVDIEEMRVGELLSLMPSIGALMEYIGQLEDERDRLVAALRDMKDEMKANAHAVAVYPSLQDELVDLRLKMRGVGSFDEMKAELLTLRDWKKKLIKRLEPLGLVVADEGEQ